MLIFFLFLTRPVQWATAVYKRLPTCVIYFMCLFCWRCVSRLSHLNKRQRDILITEYVDFIGPFSSVSLFISTASKRRSSSRVVKGFMTVLAAGYLETEQCTASSFNMHSCWRQWPNPNVFSARLNIQFSESSFWQWIYSFQSTAVVEARTIQHQCTLVA